MPDSILKRANDRSNPIVAETALARSSIRSVNKSTTAIKGFLGELTERRKKEAKIDAVNQAAKDDNAYRKAQLEARQNPNDKALQNNLDKSEKTFRHRENALTLYGQAYNKQATANYTAHAENDMENTNNHYATLYQNDPMEYKHAMDTYNEKVAEKAPTEAVQSSLAITGRKVRNSTFGKLAFQKDQDLRKDQKRTYLENNMVMQGNLINSITAGDKKSEDLIRHKMGVYTKTMLDSGIMQQSEIDAINYKGHFNVRKGVEENKLQSHLEKGDLQGAIDMVTHMNSFVPNDLDPVEWENLKSTLNTHLNQYISANKLGAGINKEVANTILKNYTNASKNGKTPNPVPAKIVNSASVSARNNYTIERKSSNLFQKLKVDSLGDEATFFKAYTDLMDQLKDSTTPQDILVAQGVQKKYEHERVLIKKDPMTWAVNNAGMPSYDIKVDDMSQLPNAINQSIAISKQKGTAAKPLRVDQVDSANAYWNDISVPVEDKVKMLSDIEEHSNGKSDLVYNQIQNKKNYNMAFAGSISKNNPNAAKAVIQGGQADVKLDSITSDNIILKLTGIFDNFSDSNEFNKNVKGTIDYLKGEAIQGKTGLNADDAIENTIGTVATYNGKKTLVPFGVDEDDFNDFINSYTIPGHTETTEALHDMNDMFGSGNMQLVYNGPGKYLLMDGDTRQLIPDSKGSPIEITYPGESDE